MSSDDHPLAGPERRDDLGLVIWEDTGDRVLEAFGSRNRDRTIAPVVGERPIGTIRIERRWWNVEAPAPDLDLLFPEAVIDRADRAMYEEKAAA